MKKAYLLLLLCLSSLTACTKSSNENKITKSMVTNAPDDNSRACQVISENNDFIKNERLEKFRSNEKFLIDRLKVKKPGFNISVDDALSLIIDQLALPNSPTTAYRFLGYDTLDDGLCYIIGYGALSGNDFTETSRFAVSYNKTIYKAEYKNKQVGRYKEVYSLETGQTIYKNDITATIDAGTLYIKDSQDDHVISSFSLQKYDLEKAKDDDIQLLDMNFDGYLDIAIRSKISKDSYTYHAFLYQKKKKQFVYEIAYSYLPSPEYSVTTKTIGCRIIKNEEYIYDTYKIVNNQPEISDRLLYHYESGKRKWRMDHYKGELGELILEKTAYYTNKQVSELIGQFVADN